MTRIVKYNYGLWDKLKYTGFINIFDTDFYICTRWHNGALVEVPQLPLDANQFFYTWYEKLKRQGYTPAWDTDLISDFWVEKDGMLILENLGIEIIEVEENTSRVRQLESEWFPLPPKNKIENFQNLSLLGI